MFIAPLRVEIEVTVGKSAADLIGSAAAISACIPAIEHPMAPLRIQIQVCDQVRYLSAHQFRPSVWPHFNRVFGAS